MNMYTLFKRLKQLFISKIKNEYSIGKVKNYWVFISYSHHDKAWANWLHKELETYAIPKDLIGRSTPSGDTCPDRLFPVFQDREELPTAADLGDLLQRALIQSRFLIVICSPHSARSRWVNEEIKIFRKMGRGNRILALIVAGDPNVTDEPELRLEECFPEALRFELGEDGKLDRTMRCNPVAADVRPNKDSKSDALLRLIAGLLGVGFDELRRREVKRQQRYWISLTAIISLIILIVSGLVLVAKQQAERAKQELEQKQEHQSRFLASKSEEFLKDNQYVFAALTAEAGLPKYTEEDQRDRTLVPEALSAYQNATLHDQRTGSIGDNIESFAFSPDGQWLVTQFGIDINVLDVEKLQTTKIFNHKKLIFYKPQFFFTPDGKKVLATGFNKLKLFDFESQKVITELKGHTGHIVFAQFSLDSSRLLILSDDKILRLWDTINGQIIVNFRDVREAALSPNGKIAAFADNSIENHKLNIFETETGKYIAKLSGHSSFITSLAFSPDGLLLASASDDQTSRIWEVNSAKLKAVLQIHGGRVDDLVFSGQTQLITATEDGVVRQWLIGNNDNDVKLDLELKGHVGRVRALSLSPDCNILIVLSGDHEALVWDLVNGFQIGALSGIDEKPVFRPNSHQFAVLHSHVLEVWDFSKTFRVISRVHLSNGNTHGKSEGVEQINRLGISPDGRWTVEPDYQGNRDNFLFYNQIKDVNDKTRWPEKNFLSGVFSPDSNKLAALEFDGKVHLFSTNKRQEILTIPDYSYDTSMKFSYDTSMKFSSDSQFLAITDEKYFIHIFNLKNRKEVCVFKGHFSKISALSFRYDNHFLASSSTDGTSRIWNLTTGEEIYILDGKDELENLKQIVVASSEAFNKQIEAFNKQIIDVEFSQDGSLLVTYSRNGITSIWDAGIGAKLFEKPGAYIGFTKNSGQLIIFDQGFYFIDSKTGGEIAKIQTDDLNITHVKLSPDNRYIVASTNDNFIHIWNVEKRKKIAKLDLKTKETITGLEFSNDADQLFVYLENNLSNNAVRILNSISWQDDIQLYYERASAMELLSAKERQQLFIEETLESDYELSPCDLEAGDRYDSKNPYRFNTQQMNQSLEVVQKSCSQLVEENKHNLRYHYQLARALNANDKKDEAIALANQVCKSGYAASCFFVALIENDPSKAVPLLQSAEKLGSSAAASELAYYYWDGVNQSEPSFSLQVDRKHAIELWEKAANAGIPKALRTLGYIYERGEEVEINPETAFYYHALAAKQFEVFNKGNWNQFNEKYLMDFETRRRGTLARHLSPNIVAKIWRQKILNWKPSE